MVSAAGVGVGGSCAAIRAQICRFREVENLYYCQGDNASGERAPVVMAPAFKERPREALGALCLGALRDLVGSSRLARRDLSSLRLSLCLPSWAPAAQSRDALDRFLRDLAAQAGFAGIQSATVTAGGHSGMLAAISQAAGDLAARGERGCVLAGVGSYFNTETLAALDAAGRLKSERNRDGFVPGECGVAILLESVSALEKRGAAPLAILRGTGNGREPRGIVSGNPSSGQGLRGAIEQAFASAQLNAGVEWVVCDLNGESFRAREWGLVQSYLPTLVGTVRRVWHPADCIGDVGAASGGVLLATVARAFARGYHPATRALVWAGSDEGARSAMIIDKPGTERN
jgi:3-oxoacyl-[acyl-carrier-protein] synthase-1